MIDRANSAELVASQHHQPTAKSRYICPEHHVVTLFAPSMTRQSVRRLVYSQHQRTRKALAKWRVLSLVPQQESIINGRVEPST